MTKDERRAAFGSTIRNDILRTGLHQKDIANQAGITRQQLNRIINAESGTTEETVEALACALGASVTLYRYLAGYAAGENLAPDVELTQIVYSVPTDRRPALIEAVRVMARAIAA